MLGTAWGLDVDFEAVEALQTALTGYLTVVDQPPSTGISRSTPVFFGLAVRKLRDGLIGALARVRRRRSPRRSLFPASGTPLTFGVEVVPLLPGPGSDQDCVEVVVRICSEKPFRNSRCRPSLPALVSLWPPSRSGINLC